MCNKAYQIDSLVLESTSNGADADQLSKWKRTPNPDFFVCADPGIECLDNNFNFDGVEENNISSFHQIWKESQSLIKENIPDWVEHDQKTKLRLSGISHIELTSDMFHEAAPTGGISGGNYLEIEFTVSTGQPAHASFAKNEQGYYRLFYIYFLEAVDGVEVR